MTVTEQPEQNAHRPSPSQPQTAGTAPAGQPVPVAELVAARLAEAGLDEPVKALLREALGSVEEQGASPTGRIYLESVAVSGFRGIGPRAFLNLTPYPGVNLVVGRNGSGKSSLAEGIETAFTGTNARWRRQDAARRGNWRNLHDGARPQIEVKLAIKGDPGRATLTRTWKGDDFDDSEAELRRPGHGRIPADQADWRQALTDYRPFLSYVDLDHMISGRPAQMYDAIAVILGLGHLSAASGRLQEEEKRLSETVKAVATETGELKKALYTLEDDPRALEALVAIDTKETPDLAAVEALVAGLPTADDGRLAELRLTAGLHGPDMMRVGTVVDRLRAALDRVEEVRATDAEDAFQRADLLARALEHRDRHTGTDSCPVCGTSQVLDGPWAARAAAQIAALRQEGKAAEDARGELRSAKQAVQELIQIPERVPPALAGPWNAWRECRTLADPAELAERILGAAITLTDACAAARQNAVAELETRNERWRPLAVRLANWAGQASAAERDKPRLHDVKKARDWLKKLATKLREQRMAGFADQSQRIWERLRQESNIDLTRVSLHGSEKATVRRLVMDVSVDGAEASALSVMSQGEQHSLALSLFLPRAATADSPFGFVVIDDPVQSMDPAKVNGLAQVLHELGRQRQVVVFTHDTRLQRAFTSQELPVTMLLVERAEASRVKVRLVKDPVAQALEDAWALVRTRNLPAVARSHVLPSLCRIALENAFIEAAWIRHHRSGGGSEQILQAAVAKSDRLKEVAALALFGDVERADEVDQELRTLYGPYDVGLVRQCQEGSHSEGTQIADAHRFVRDIEAIVAKVRKPQVTAP
ncbi:hypothetical protein FDG2_1828 [Candidatus Protofrankia californiensis]|uniref:Nuclease SbcCD subunit C n=1 Tax=Candidatus Protofrankia californiensis TaxID=1839754 RepID=A0A1C3NWE3_9ACTN|nr:hypothetical protein FDG2_1828 [Candidatus Protofrankia californiensis]